MKKFIIGFQIVVLLAVFCGNSFSQIRTDGTRTEKDSVTGMMKTVTYTEIRNEETITPRHDMITINPLKFILFWNLSYYHSFGNIIAGGIGLQMPTLSSFKGFGANAEIRLYPSKKSLRGFYVAPNFSWNHLTYQYHDYLSSNSSSSSSVGADTYSIGVLLGWQWFIGDDFAIGLGLGFDHYFLSASGSSSDYNIFGSYSGNLPSLRFDIGYAW